jgi:hypothetical protein
MTMLVPEVLEEAASFQVEDVQKGPMSAEASRFLTAMLGSAMRMLG